MPFNPKKFSAPKKRTITIGNSAHPVLEHVVGPYLCKIPSKDALYADLFYIELKDGKGIVTYHDCSHYPSVQYHEKTLEEFKAIVKAGESFNSPYEVVNCDPKNKWLGNDIMNLLYCEAIVEYNA